MIEPNKKICLDPSALPSDAPADGSWPIAGSEVIAVLSHQLDDATFLPLMRTSSAYHRTSLAKERLAAAVLREPRAADKTEFRNLLEQVPEQVAKVREATLDPWRLHCLWDPSR